ncbi:MAG TPA: sulfotransferase [Gammaproteobacteria bacterium]|nr:sulfotransferase [Gammaproteobacteria bacterium]
MPHPDAPRQAEIHRLMSAASVAYGQGDHGAATRAAIQVLALQADQPDALHLLGLCRMAAGDLSQAIASMARAAALKPADAGLQHNLGVALADSGAKLEAREAFARAAALDPRRPESQFNLGVTSEETGAAEAAEAAYRRCLALAPEHVAAAAGLASLQEQRSELEEAGRWCETALKHAPTDPVARLTHAQLRFRAGELEPAASELESLRQEVLTPRNRALVTGRLGALYDRLGRAQDAWRMYLEAKTALHETLAAGTGEGPYSFPVAARSARYLGRLLVAPTEDGPDSPVFLVGFPRSGTTLLDQILSGHPEVTVLEEQDTLQDFLARYALRDSGMEALLSASSTELAADRQRYWQRVDAYLAGRPRRRVFVDKLPLNTLFVPHLKRLFPAARFVFSLRDPRDVVLSCFMQSFVLNEAMRHFLSLEETAEFYAAVMEVGRRSFAAMPKAVFTLRYEDLLEDTEGRARALLEFLELPWDQAVLDYQATAKGRRINTPSYHQVARPLYKEARERWRRYAEELAPVMDSLQPFVEAFGYK